MPGMWPRNATCGLRGAPDEQQERHQDRHHHAFENAQQQHGGESDHRHAEFETADPPHVAQFTDVDQPLDGHQHDGREHHVGQVAQHARQEHQAQTDRDRGEHQRERRLGAGLVVHRRLRQAASHRVGLEERRGQIRRAQAEQFLARIDFVAILCARARAADTLSTYASSRHANASGITPSTSRSRNPGRWKSGRPCGNSPTTLKPRSPSGVTDNTTMESDHHEQRDRAARQEFLAQQQHGQRDETESQHGEIGIGELAAQDGDALEEDLPAALDPEQLGQLRHGDRQRRAGLEAEQDGFADEVDEGTQSQQPCQHAHGRHDQRGQRRDVGPACRIALRHARDRDADEHRDRRGGADRELARGAEQRVEQAADQVAVDAVLRRQPGERRVGERHRNAVGGEGHAGDGVVRQPLRPIRRRATAPGETPRATRGPELSPARSLAGRVSSVIR